MLFLNISYAILKLDLYLDGLYTAVILHRTTHLTGQIMNATMTAATLPSTNNSSMFVGLGAKLLSLAKYIRPMDGVEMTFDNETTDTAAAPVTLR